MGGGWQVQEVLGDARQRGSPPTTGARSLLA